MKNKDGKLLLRAFFLLCIAAVPLTPKSASAVLLNINSGSLNGTSARLDFQLLDGDLTANNSAAVSLLSTNGTLQGNDCSVGCTGGPPFVVNDALGLGQFIQDLVLGTVLSFDLALTNNFAGGDADLLVLNLLDPNSNFSLVNTDLDALAGPVPYQDALLVFNFQSGQFLLPGSSSPNILVNVARVAEPHASLLLGLGLIMLAAIARRSAAKPLTNTINH